MTENTNAAAAPVRRPMPKLMQGEVFVVVTTAAVAGLLGILGFAASFTAVSKYATAHGFPADGFLVPVAIDLAILVFSIANVVLVRLEMRLKWVKWLTWALTGVTIYLNVTTGTDPFAKVAHAVMPALWVAMCAIAEHGYKRWAGLLSGRHMDRIRLSRWLLAPWPTFKLWRRMVLWEVVNYRDALTREVTRLAFLMRLRDSYGSSWRRTAPISDRIRARFDLAAEEVPSLSGTPAEVPAPVAEDAGVDAGVDADGDGPDPAGQVAPVDNAAPIAAEVDGQVDAEVDERNPETARALILAGWFTGETVASVVRKSGRGRTYVYRQYKAFDDQYGPRPRADDTGEIPILAAVNGTARN
ncbi:MAG TPA: DUF2637 domain-containing protein [Candidatus Udaeobacter sp.]|nr:DUF2637 domain-containing protein [Candidatus Udaeobacter sp.]